MHFLEGVLIDSTAYKGTFRIWSLLSPLWEYVPQPCLGYSDDLWWFEGSEQAIAERAAGLLQDNRVFRERLTAPEISLETFLSTTLGHVTINTPNSTWLTHRGIALALLGQTDAALETLDIVVRGVAPGRTHPWIDWIKAVTQSLAKRDGNHEALITQWEAASLAPLGLDRASPIARPGDG